MFLSTFIGVFLLCCAVNSDEIVETTTFFAEDDIIGHPNVYVLPKTCGLINRKSLAGNTATLKEFPWMVTIGYKTSSGSQWKGTATIIILRHILSAFRYAKFEKIGGDGIGEFYINLYTNCESQLRVGVAN